MSEVVKLIPSAIEKQKLIDNGRNIITYRINMENYIKRRNFNLYKKDYLYKGFIKDEDFKILSKQIIDRDIETQKKFKLEFEKKGMEYIPLFYDETHCYNMFKNVDIDKFYGWFGLIDFDDLKNTQDKKIQYNKIRLKYTPQDIESIIKILNTKTR